MWLDPKNFKDYDVLVKATMLAQDIFKELDVYSIDTSLVEHIGEEITEVNWFGIIVYQKEPIKSFVADKIDPRFKIIYDLFDNTDSIYQAVINVVGPNSVTPLHNDSRDYESNPIRIGYTRGRITPYQMMTGIQTPEGDIGMEFVSGYTMRWKDGDIMAFDGSEDHHGWNRTSSPRITMFLDVDKNAFN
jgi:hypothetical protein